MKNLIKGLAFLSMLSLFSCTRVLYTPEQVMGRYQNKKDVITRFGAPAEIKANDDGSEEWLYKFEKKTPSAGHSSNEQRNVKTVTVTRLNRYKRYIIFTIDRQGDVISWKFEGINLEEKQKNPGGTIALIAGSAAFIGLIVLVAHGLTSGLGNAFGGGSLY
jgi:hypothetical protein